MGSQTTGARRAEAGQHAGEIEARGEDIGRIAVNITARVATLVCPEEAFVSRTMNDTVAGSTLNVSERAERDREGVPGRRRVFAVVD